MNTLSTAEQTNGGKRSRPGSLKHHNHNDLSGDGHPREFISKNLDAERRRRAKIHDRLMALRSVVPNITNMKKETIIVDAITYIKELQLKVKFLSDQLLEMEAQAPQEPIHNNRNTENRKKCKIEQDVQASGIGANKFWIKIVMAKKEGSFTKFIEAISFFGFEIHDISLSTSDEAVLLSTCIEGPCYDDSQLSAEQVKNLAIEIMRST